MKKSDNPQPAAEMRRRAEKRIKEKANRKKPDGAIRQQGNDPQALLQELHVHQIELEMQNEELQKSRTEVERLLGQYTELYDFAPVGYVSLDRTGVILRVNMAGAELLRTERARLLNRRFEPFVAVGDQPRFARLLVEAFAEQAAPAARERVCEVVLVSEGSRPPVSQTSWGETRRHVRIVARKGQNDQECLAVISDITRAKDAERQLQKAKRFLLETFDNMTDFLMLIDPATHAVLQANRPFLDYCGRSEAAVIGQRCYELNHQGAMPCSPVTGKCPLEETLKTGISSTAEHLHRDAAGRARIFEVRTVPITNNKMEIRQIIHISRDITERRQTEELLHKQREDLLQYSRFAVASEFASSVAHEIQQPLTAIMNNAQASLRFLSAERPAIEEVCDALQDIINDDRRASEVIHTLRSCLGKGNADWTVLEVNTLIKEVMQLLNRQIFQKGVPATIDLGPDLPLIEGDRIALQQVLINLIMNGCDSMQNTEPRFRQLSIRTRLSGESGIAIAVQDAGTGLGEDAVRRLFSPFYTTKENGLGLGLSISRSLITAHGGRIWAENNPGGGATFHITLPARKEKGRP